MAEQSDNYRVGTSTSSAGREQSPSASPLTSVAGVAPQAGTEGSATTGAGFAATAGGFASSEARQASTGLSGGSFASSAGQATREAVRAGAGALREGAGPGEAARRVAAAGSGPIKQLSAEMRGAAESMIEEQKSRAAGVMGDLAEKLRRTGRNIDPDNGTIARYADQAADTLRAVSEDMRQRPWNDLVADAEGFAHRQPALFLLGAAAIGFALGRFIATSSDRSSARSAASYRRDESYDSAMGSESFVRRGSGAYAGSTPPMGAV